MCPAPDTDDDSKKAFYPTPNCPVSDSTKKEEIEFSGERRTETIGHGNENGNRGHTGTNTTSRNDQTSSQSRTNGNSTTRIGGTQQQQAKATGCGEGGGDEDDNNNNNRKKATPDDKLFDDAQRADSGEDEECQTTGKNETCLNAAGTQGNFPTRVISGGAQGSHLDTKRTLVDTETQLMTNTARTQLFKATVEEEGDTHGPSADDDHYEDSGSEQTQEEDLSVSGRTEGTISGKRRVSSCPEISSNRTFDEPSRTQDSLTVIEIPQSFVQNEEDDSPQNGDRLLEDGRSLGTEREDCLMPEEDIEHATGASSIRALSGQDIPDTESKNKLHSSEPDHKHDAQTQLQPVAASSGRIQPPQIPAQASGSARRHENATLQSPAAGEQKESGSQRSDVRRKASYADSRMHHTPKPRTPGLESPAAGEQKESESQRPDVRRKKSSSAILRMHHAPEPDMPELETSDTEEDDEVEDRRIRITADIPCVQQRQELQMPPKYLVRRGKRDTTPGAGTDADHWPLPGIEDEISKEGQQCATAMTQAVQIVDPEGTTVLATSNETTIPERQQRPYALIDTSQPTPQPQIRAERVEPQLSESNDANENSPGIDMHLELCVRCHERIVTTVHVCPFEDQEAQKATGEQDNGPRAFFDEN